MNFMRKGLVASLTTAFVVLLFVIAFDVGLVRSIGHPATVKKVLSDSGLYDSVVPNALNQVKNVSTSVGDVPLTDTQIKAAAAEAFTPVQIQTYANQIIDSVYDWLDGKTATPQFQIDLSGPKNTFVTSITNNLQAQLAGLPACTSAAGASFDAYNATCLPPGVTASQAAEQVRAQLLSGQGFLDQPVVNADTIKNSGSSQTIFDNQQIPKNYQRAKKAPIVAGLLALLAAVGITFLSASRRRGLRRVGIALAAAGVFMLLFAWGTNRIFTQNVLPKIKLDSAVVQKEVSNVATDLVQAIDKNYWMFGIIYAVLGASLIAGTKFVAASKPAHTTPHAHEDTERLEPQGKA